MTIELHLKRNYFFIRSSCYICGYEIEPGELEIVTNDNLLVCDACVERINPALLDAKKEAVEYAKEYAKNLKEYEKIHEENGRNV